MGCVKGEEGERGGCGCGGAEEESEGDKQGERGPTFMVVLISVSLD